VNPKVCVLGASGFVGSAIISRLEMVGIDWVGVSRNANDHPKFIQASLDDRDMLSELITDYSCVINAMGSHKPKDFESDTKLVFCQFWESIQKLNLILRDSKVDTLLHISSAGTVYGEYIDEPFKEDSLLLPISWYGRAKTIEESLYEKQAYEFGFNYKCARLANPFGNEVYTKHGFIDVLINTVKTGGIFNTFKDHGHCRDFIHSSDMAEVIVNILLMESTNPIEIFNVASGNSKSLSDLLIYTKKLIPEFTFKYDFIASDYDVRKNILDVSKIKALGIFPKQLKTSEDYIYRKLLSK
tara:strand:- start:1220 stop:2116 length:897 start_codon:yes stop_codon:yes gene_type:complete